MKASRSLVVLAALVLAGTVLAAEWEIPAVPASLAPDQQTELNGRRDKILAQGKEFAAHRDAFDAKFGRIVAKDSPRAAEAAQRKEALLKEGEEFALRAGMFQTDLIAALEEQIAALHEQTEAIRRQMKGLGFGRTTEEFERLGQTSTEEVQRLKTELIARLRDLLLPKVPPDAQGRIRGRDDLFEFPEKAAPETVKARQEAALSLLSSVMKHPVLDELKAMGPTGDNAGEAWFYYFNLNRAAEALWQTTDKQLQEQKALAGQLGDLFHRKKATQADLKALEAAAR